MKENMFKSVESPSCIDLILTNSVVAFQNTPTVFIGLSDFDKLISTVLKISIIKSKPQKTTYGDYKIFVSVKFNDELKYFLVKEKITSSTKFD